MIGPSWSTALLSLAVAVLVVIVAGHFAIPQLRRLKIGQRVRDDGPQSHLKKMGVPTMGGLFFAWPGLVLTLLWAPLDSRLRVAVIFSLVFGAVGFVDDYLKVVKRRPLGLRARYKLAVQIPASVLLGYWVMQQSPLGSTVSLPFGLGAIGLGWLYVPFVALLATFMSNAVNITDGADGLLAGAMLPTLGAYFVIARGTGQPGLALLCASLLGACLAFLRYNRYPAKVIMGDTGSLALGGAITALGVLTKTEAILVVAGLLYVLEAGSVILQVISFRTTGRRIFRMSPVHHHFEVLGYPEETVVRGFWLVSLLSGLLGLLCARGLLR